MSYKKNSSRWWFTIIILASFTCCFAIPPPDKDDGDDSTCLLNPDDQGYDEGYIELVNWVRMNDGRVDKRLGMGYNSEGIRGGIALDDISAGTELLFCPWKLVLGTEEDTSIVMSSGDQCSVMKFYAEQVRAGKESFWYPYLNLDDSLGDGVSSSRIPALWNDSTLHEFQGLPPYAQSIQSKLTEWFSNTCANGIPFKELDAADRQSLLATITRGAGMRFLPIYDLLNHNNGQLNTKSEANHLGDSVIAVVDIPTGSEIFSSYRGERTTSSEIFQRYGFLESYPQQWAWIDPITLVEERFLLLSQLHHDDNDMIAIHPPNSMTEGIGTVAQPLVDLKGLIGPHHHNGISSKELQQFIDSAQRLLHSLPTTVQEDISILNNLKDRMSVTSSEEADEKMQLQDTISVVMYRHSFKTAIEIAVTVAEDVLGKK